jgi:Transcriptional Coactivator p15 (PC4)
MNGPGLEGAVERMIPKNRSETIRVAAGVLNGVPLVDLRIMVATASGAVQTRKGLCMRVETATALRAALDEVMSEAGFTPQS